jgi:hypothetical protein
MPGKPRYDEELRALFLGADLEKELIQPAPLQEPILRGLQAAGWPEIFYDPLPYLPPAAARRRLHDAVRGLNRGLRTGRIRFFTHNHATAIRWRLGNGRKSKRPKKSE